MQVDGYTRHWYGLRMPRHCCNEANICGYTSRQVSPIRERHISVGIAVAWHTFLNSYPTAILHLWYIQLVYREADCQYSTEIDKMLFTISNRNL